MPSEIAAKIDMCENGSEMVQAKYKVKYEKISPSDIVTQRDTNQNDGSAKIQVRE